MDKIKYIKRTINFYELEISFNDDFQSIDNDKIREFFSRVSKLAKTRAKIRYQNFGEKAIFVQDVTFERKGNILQGKIRCIRKDLLPEIMNTNTDEAKGIEAKEEEGLVETTHFVIDYSNSKCKLAIEYNQFGARISDFINYLMNIGLHFEAFYSIKNMPIVNNDLTGLKKRLRKCSEFIVKVHKDNIPYIKEIDTDLFSALEASLEHFNCDYATLDLQFNYKRRTETKKVNNIITKVIDKLSNNKNNLEYFNTLQIKSEDSEKNNLLEIFDLLVDKVKSEIYVQKIKRYRTIVSLDIFDKIKNEMKVKNIV